MQRKVTFKMELADCEIEVECLYHTSKLFCKDYLCTEQENSQKDQNKNTIVISVGRAEIEFERKKSEQEDLIEGRAIQKYSDAYLETLAIYRKIAEHILEYRVLLIHGSLIAVDGKGYLFVARSGTGKSTHTKLWREQFGERAVMVNDDKPLLRISEGNVYAYGTPWDGKHRISNNIKVPLKAICVLERGKENNIAVMGEKERCTELLKYVYHPSDPMKIIKILDLFPSLMKQVAFYRMQCNMKKEAAVIASEAMVK